MRSNSFIVTFNLIFLAIILSACAQENPEPARLWEKSAHADTESRAFTNWDDRDPAEIPENCAKCHSTHGYRDFLGDDGSEPGVVNEPAATGTTVACGACHNDVAETKTKALMPSGEVIEELGQESNCMECHQGRASGVDVHGAIEGKPLDSIDSELSFINVHNRPPGPTQFGTLALGGFEYSDQEYVGRYGHSPDFTTCIECHDAHSLAIRIESCTACHPGVETEADLRNIRTTGIDYDLDGDVSEGIADEIETLLDLLIKRMNLYALSMEGVDQLQYEDRRPYFFDEAGEEYSTWTPRLLGAAYNYHFVAKEPSGYAHNNRYQLQLLYDSLVDMGADPRILVRPNN